MEVILGPCHRHPNQKFLIHINSVLFVVEDLMIRLLQDTSIFAKMLSTSLNQCLMEESHLLQSTVDLILKI